MFFQLAVDRLEAIAKLLDSCDGYQLQLAIDGRTLPPVPEDPVEGTDVCIRVISDKTRPSAQWPHRAPPADPEHVAIIDLVEVAPAHLQVTIDGVVHWDVLGPGAGVVRLSAPQVVLIGTDVDIAHDGEPEYLAVMHHPALSSLGSMAHWSSLRGLDLFAVPDLEDISAITALEELSHLRFRDCSKLDNLSALVSCPHLESLDVQAWPLLGDLSPLAPMTGLRSLNISKAGALESLKGLEDMATLETLEAGGCPKLTDVSALSGMKALQKLQLKGSKAIEDLSVLTHLSGLLDLGLESTAAVVSLDLIAGNPGLQKLSLRHCKSLKDISALRRLPCLDTLLLEGCTNVSDFSPLGALSQLVRLSLRRCKAFSELEILAPCQALEELNISDCTYVDDWTTLDSLHQLHTLKGVPPGIEVRTLATHASARGATNLIANRLGMFADPDSRSESWMDVAHKQADTHGLLGALGRALQELFSWENLEIVQPKPAEAMVALLRLASSNTATGVAPLIQAACDLAEHPPIRDGIAETVKQQDAPLPPDTLVAVAALLPEASDPPLQDLVKELRPATLKALGAQVASETVEWAEATGEAVRLALDTRLERFSAAEPLGRSALHDELLDIIEASPGQPVGSALFGSLSADYAQRDDQGWVTGFHARLVGHAMAAPDKEERGRRQSEIATGLARARDQGWSIGALDSLLKTAATVDSDTSLLQSAVANAHGTAGRWSSAEETALSIGEPNARDQCLLHLVARVLPTELVERAQRALSMANAVGSSQLRLDTLCDIGARPELAHDAVAYGQLLALLAESPSRQQRVVAHAVGFRPDLAGQSAPNPKAPLTTREHQSFSLGQASATQVWRDAVHGLAPHLLSELEEVIGDKLNPGKPEGS